MLGPMVLGTSMHPSFIIMVMLVGLCMSGILPRDSKSASCCRLTRNSRVLQILAGLAVGPKLVGLESA